MPGAGFECAPGCPPTSQGTRQLARPASNAGAHRSRQPAHSRFSTPGTGGSGKPSETAALRLDAAHHRAIRIPAAEARQGAETIAHCLCRFLSLTLGSPPTTHSRTIAAADAASAAAADSSADIVSRLKAMFRLHGQRLPRRFRRFSRCVAHSVNRHQSAP